MKIKINNLPGYRSGKIIRIEDDGNNPPQPKSNYWRRRLKDAQTDGCCEIVRELEDFE